MSAVQEPKSREQIQDEFKKLLRVHEQRASQISTKAQAAEQVKDRELVERAAGYTVESIINSLAKLQLGFGSAVDAIAGQLGDESSKLGELRRAIEVEDERLQQLHATVVAAEALAIVKQDSAKRRAALDEEAKAAKAALEAEQAEQREAWTREKAEQQAEQAQYEAEQAKERQQAEEDHAYELERKAKVEADGNATKRRELERRLADEEAAKAKDWAAREKALDERADEIAALRTKVAGFDQELEAAITKAREKAIASVNRDAKFELEMLKKEHQGNVQVFELKVQTLEDRIKRQSEQIIELNTKLDATIAKSQGLAEQAFHRPTPSAGA